MHQLRYSPHAIFRSRWQALVTVLVLLVGVILASAPASVARADDTQSFSGAPSDGTHSDPTRTRFTFIGDPGKVIEDAYYLENTGTVEQTINVYAADAYNNGDDGAFSLYSADNPGDYTASWITFDGQKRVTVTLPPQSSKVLAMKVSIPLNAKPGDHIGGVVASVTSAGGNVQIERRVATKIYIRVSGTLQPALTISGASASYEPSWNPFDGKINVTFTVKNTGNVSLGANTVAAVTGLFGFPLSGSVFAATPELLPDGSRVISMSVPGVWQWLWMNTNLAIAGVPDKNAPSPGQIPTATREASVWSLPYDLLAVLAIFGGLYAYRRWRRERDERLSREWLEYQEILAQSQAEEKPTS